MAAPDVKSAHGDVSNPAPKPGPNAKYRLLLDDTIMMDGRCLYRIEALRDFWTTDGPEMKKTTKGPEETGPVLRIEKKKGGNKGPSRRGVSCETQFS